MLSNELNTINTLFYNNSPALSGLICKGNELIKLFNNKSFKNFKQKDIEKYFTYLLKNNNKPSTINSKLAYLSKCLKYYGVNLIMPYQKLKTTEKEVITPNQLRDILQKIRLKIIPINNPDEVRQFIKIAYYTGLRASEILNLRVQHIKFENDVYYLNIYNTKNHKNNFIPVNKQLNQTLSDFKEFNINYKQLHYELKKLNINAHLFRHSFITRCFEQGLDSFTVMRLVNQTSINSTKQYVHLSNKFLSFAVQNI